MSTYNRANVDRFSGYADCYDQHRPQPPRAMTAILMHYLGRRPALVADLGAGTGISTRLWAGHADMVVGVEPNADMRAIAAARTPAEVEGTRLEFCDGHSAATGLPDGSADLVCCVQAFHWMEPAATLAEAARILRPGGLFAAVDCDWPPTITVEAEIAFKTVMDRVHRLQVERGVFDAVTAWPKERHLDNIRASGHFRYAREVVMHQEETGGVARLVGIVMSQGGVEDLLKLGVTEEEMGLPEFRAAARAALGDRVVPWVFGYRMRVGAK
jgi:SAM-dependent methyltransferase